MARLEVQVYRGFQVYFDTETEEFCGLSDRYDTEAVRDTYKGLLRYIDKYIKDNAKFKPIKVINGPLGREITLVGLRLDGQFMYLNKDGKPVRLPKWDAKDYHVINPENFDLLEELERIDDQIQVLKAKYNEAKKRYKPGMDLKQLRLLYQNGPESD